MAKELSKQNARTGRIYPNLVEKTISRTRTDIAKWKTAWNNATNADYPSRWQLYTIVKT